MTVRHPFAGEQSEVSASARPAGDARRWPWPRRWRATPFACALLLTILLGWTLRVADLGRFSLSIDELIDIEVAQGSVPDMIGDLRNAEDLHPPLPHFVTHYWIELAGDSNETLLRFPWGTLGAASIPLLYVLGARLFGHSTGLLASFLLAASPILVHYSPLVKYYSLTLLLVLLSAVLFLRALDSGRKRDWGLYSLAAVLLLYCDYLGALLLPMLVVYAQMVGAPGGRRSALASTGLAFLVAAPLVPIFLAQASEQAGRPTADVVGLPGVAARLAYTLFAFALGDTIFPWEPAAVAGLIVFTALAVLGAYWLVRNHQRDQSGPLFILLLLVVPLLTITVVVNYALSAVPLVYYPTHLLFLVPFFCLLVASGWRALPNGRLKAVALLVIACAFGASLSNYFTAAHFANPIYVVPTKEIVAHVQDNLQPGDVVVSDADSSFAYYYEHSDALNPQFAAQDDESVRSYLTSHPEARVWLFTLGRDATRGFSNTGLTEWLETHYRLIETEGYAEQDQTYRNVKEWVLDRQSYRYKAVLQRFDP